VGQDQVLVVGHDPTTWSLGGPPTPTWSLLRPNGMGQDSGPTQFPGPMVPGLWDLVVGRDLVPSL
jgi:hypothetical protein